MWLTFGSFSHQAWEKREENQLWSRHCGQYSGIFGPNPIILAPGQAHQSRNGNSGVWVKTGFCRLLFKKCVYCKHLDIFSVEILRLLPACPPSGDGRIFPYTVIPQEAELKATQSSQVAWANQSKHVIAHIMQLKGLCKKNQERKKNKKHAARRCCISLLRTPVPWPWHSGKRQRWCRMRAWAIQRTLSDPYKMWILAPHYHTFNALCVLRLSVLLLSLACQAPLSQPA